MQKLEKMMGDTMKTLFASNGLLLLMACIFCLGTACNSKKVRFDPAGFYSAEALDSLKADLMTFVYFEQKGVRGMERFKPENRSFYVSKLSEFDLQRYHISPEGQHYFYMVRPARGPNEFKQRGVGGTFRKDEQGAITGFREVFNTPTHSPEKLKGYGLLLFEEMVATGGNVDQFLNNETLIEWPNFIAKYDTTLYEWVYKEGFEPE
jgi:hypothetical protein